MIALLAAPLLAAAVVAGVAVLMRLQRRRQAQLVGRRLPRTQQAPRRAHLLYFTGDSCAICHTAQRPALERLRALVGNDVQIEEIDVAREPALARRYRVMTLPTTLVLDVDGTVRAVNAGFAATEVLREQLAPMLAAA